MVKSLADELSDILNWNENPGCGATAVEQARMGLITFCRGLVCGLRAGNKPLVPVEGLADKSQPNWDEAEQNLRARAREERARRYDKKNVQLHLVDECNMPMMGTPLEERLKDS